MNISFQRYKFFIIKIHWWFLYALQCALLLNKCFSRNISVTITIKLGNVIPPEIQLKSIHSVVERDRLTIDCNTMEKNVMELTISRRLDGKTTFENMASIRPGSNARLYQSLDVSKYRVSGHSDGRYLGIYLTQVKCNDAGLYICNVSLNSGKKASVNERVNLSPLNVSLSTDPLNSTFTPGTELTLTCDGIVGTPDLNGFKSRLTWVFQERGSSATNYQELDDSLSGGLSRKLNQFSNMTCSESHRVTLKFTLDRVRDSFRNYVCVVERAKKTYKSFPFSVSHIEIPLYEKRISDGDGVNLAAYVGVVLGAVVFVLLLIFIIVLLIRFQKKKAERRFALQRRQTKIDNRRKSLEYAIGMRPSITDEGDASQTNDTLETKASSAEESVDEGSEEKDSS